jgi:outer membrane protein OmpA-like peptidoglycan-associated protein
VRPLVQTVLAFLAAAAPVFAQPVVLAYSGADSYVVTEKSDWSRYEDGRYLGHVYREVRGRLEPESPSPDALWKGDFLVFEETLRDMSAMARRVDDQIPAAFRVGPDGSIRMAVDKGFPGLRGFPAFPPGPVSPGDRWTAEGVRVVDPRNSGTPTRTRILAEYEYRGEETYKGIPVRRIFAKFAVRYRAGQDPKGDPNLREAQGTHDADILVRADTGRPVLIRDRLDETFWFTSGPSLRHRGFTLTFFDAAIPRTADPASGALRTALAGGAPASAAGISPSVPPAAPPASPGPGSPPGAGAPGAAASGMVPGSGPGSSAASGLLGAGTPGPLPSGAPALDPGPGIVLEDRPEGPTLVAFGLRFVPDQDALLPEERSRLDGIATALRAVPGDRTFLVTGHTADVGNPAGQKELSVARAKRVVDELVARGIPAARFLFRGFGAERPLAPNDTEANRARNRRVEITVLN